MLLPVTSCYVEGYTTQTTTSSAPRMPVSALSHPPSLPLEPLSSYSLPLPFLVTGSLQCNYFSPDQSQRQKHFCNFLKSSQRTTFPLIPSILFCCFNQLRTSALFLSSPLPSQKLVFFLAHDRDSMNE